MNLFENLQKLNESENTIVSEFKEFLASKNAHYIYNELGETKDGMQITIYDGDWKHEHLYMKNLINEFFTRKGIDITIESEEIGESDQDVFSARHNIIFNAEPKEYSVDIISEDVDTINEIKYVVTCQLATTNDDIYSEHSTLKDAIASARKAQQSFTNVKIKDLSDGSSWSDIDNAEQDLNDGLYEGKHYGGAFDISDTAYFTRDDLDEFSNDVIEKLSDATHADIIADVVECYLDEDTNELELTVSYGDYEHTHKEKIDMRKIKVPKDLIKAYSHKFVNEFLWCFTADTEHEEIIKESIDLSDYEYVGPATGYNKGWSLYRRVIDGKGEWVAKHQHIKGVIPINYDQVQGFEPIKLQGIQKVQKDLGDMLLPKKESNDEDYDDNAATFLDKLEKEVKEATHKFMLSVGFPEDEVDDYLSVSTDINDDYVMVAVGAELEYDSLFNLCQTLDKVIAKHDKDAYFEPECPGRIVAYLFGEKVKKVHKEKEQALKDKINSLDKVEETNHNIIEDRDYATGEKLFNALKDYLDSLDQIDMDGEDYNWQPSEFNAKNLNADGEIYLVSGAYILIYPYINEWSDQEFRVVVQDAEKLNVVARNGIQDIFNKFKTNKWQLVFED